MLYRHKLSVVLTALAAFPLIVQAEESVRTWKDRSGEYSVEAAFEKLDGGNVSLRKSNGSILVISLSRLSLADVAHVEEITLPESEREKRILNGTWGGKWDDQWDVFLIIDPVDEEKMAVQYIWRENQARPLESSDYIGERQPEGFFRGSNIHFRLIDDHVLLYGAFRNPRAARLVKLDADRNDLEEIDLAAKGWIEGVMPASEAKIAVMTEQ